MDIQVTIGMWLKMQKLTFMRKNQRENYIQNKFLLKILAKKFFKNVFFRRPWKITGIGKEVKRVTNDETNIVFVNERSLEIFSKTCDKAVAANFLLRKDGLTLKDAVSFGDGVNDYDLITQTGLGFAMENSIYRLLEKLSDTEIIESNKSDGMAKKFEKYLICKLF